MSLKSCRYTYTSFLVAFIVLNPVVLQIENSFIYGLFFVLSMLCLACACIVILVFWRCSKCNKMIPLRAYPVKEIKHCPYCKSELK
jgi:hypothetical protein